MGNNYSERERAKHFDQWRKMFWMEKAEQISETKNNACKVLPVLIPNY